MLSLDSIEVEPYKKAIEPTLKFTAKFTCTNEDILPLGCSGSLTVNNNFIGVLTPFVFGFHNEYELKPIVFNNTNVRKYNFPLIISLTKGILYKIEEVRKQNVKADLILDVIIRVKYLKSQFTSSEHNVFQNSQNIHLRSSNLFKYYEGDFPFVCKVNKMDWLHDFCPILNNSEYLVVELPINKSKKVSNKRIASTHKSISEMKDCLENGDWNGVLKASRPIWEVFKSKDDISSLLKRNGMNEQTVKSFEDLMKSLFDFTSKFIHVEAKGTREIMESNAANREDAELIYLISVSIINLLIRKA
jgi:hypothetical protein